MLYQVTVSRDDRRGNAARVVVDCGGPGEAVHKVLRVAHWLGAPTVATAVVNDGGERLGTACANVVPGVTVVAREVSDGVE